MSMFSCLRALALLASGGCLAAALAGCADEAGVASLVANGDIRQVQSLYEIELPEETARFIESEHPGYAMALQKCGICHSADYIAFQPPEKNLADWTAEVRKMHEKYGAPLSEQDITNIGAYLAITYGSASMTDEAVQLASAKSQSLPVPAQDAGTVDALLAANACLGCHAVDKKVVGPAFQDVAIKYADVEDAQAKMATSIVDGGVGRWGRVPMPPMPSLSEGEALKIAAFIMAQ